MPVMIWLILIHELQAAFWLFIAAGISDGLDGFIAKKMKVQSELGAYLDPIADKMLLVSTFVILGVQGFLPVWLVILVVFRDIAIVVGAGVIEIMTHELEMAPNFSSKINTTMQIILAATVLGVYGLDVAALKDHWQPLIYVTAGTTVVSGAVYMLQWGRKLNGWEQGN